MQGPKTFSQGLKDPFTRKGQGLQIAFGLFVVTAVVFFSTPRINASIISEDFRSTDSYINGSLVSIKQDLPGDIELSTLNNGEYLLGVVTDSESSSITFSKGNTDVSVALAGEVQVLVSNANGAVKRGDFVGASWLEGVAMKAIPDDEQKLIGVAMEDFDSESSEIYGEIATEDGSMVVDVDYVAVRLFDKESPLASANDGSVQGVFSSVVGREVSLTRVLIGSFLFGMSLILAAIFITSSVRGSFVSIGRNPMASASIHKGMIRVAALSVIIIIVGTAVSYAVLVL